jgi:hypothetical protein
MEADFDNLARQVGKGKGAALKECLDGMMAFEDRIEFLRQLCAANETIRTLNHDQAKLVLTVQTTSAREMLLGQGLYTVLWLEPGFFKGGIFATKMLYREYLSIGFAGSVKREAEYY